MTAHDPARVAGALQAAVSVLVRRLRQTRRDDDLTMSESSALSRLDRGGPTASSVLARIEQISPQSMGTILVGLESRGLVSRTPDPDDGRRHLFAVSAPGLDVLRGRRSARAERMAAALASDFTAAELDLLLRAAPLLERLAEAL